MCGIVGYIGKRDAYPILINGLKRLEYRGYDSAGVALTINGHIDIQKQVGKIAALEELVEGKPMQGTVGIAHTRWATHGEPNQRNAHPHTDSNGDIVLVHNGIVENYDALRTMLAEKGHVFRTETDTETIAHLIEEIHKTELNFEEAFRAALQELEGTYGLALITSHDPGKLFVARKGSPLVIGIGENEYFVASDASAIIAHTRDVVYLEDGEIAIISLESGHVTKTIMNEVIEKKIERITYDLERIEKAGYSHFMLKEIYEQPRTVADCMRGRLLPEEGLTHLGGLTPIKDKVIRAPKIIITACGTSYHAGLIGEYMIEEYCRLPVEVEYASEFRYRDPIIENDHLVIAISQSGETADTLAAVREAKRKGATVMGLVNVVGSTIARETPGGTYIHAGPEIGVASTKAFTSQVTALALLTVMIARSKTMSAEMGRRIVQELKILPQKVEEALKCDAQVQQVAREFKDNTNFLYLGRGYNYPVALEGALKLKEISYIHAEGYPAAEMKHGPIALIDKDMPVVFIATRDSTYEKIISNIEEVRARKGRVIAVVSEGDEKLKDMVEFTIPIPTTFNFLQPILSIIPLQLLAYHMAVLRGCNVDQPRNLAKSVTVE
ncbi:MAG: glutamine--fructose-6-phosphate transaminase (isomerizing) [Calditrichaceae bacterium]|nr:glutamine--fructose-6-phosphate transaminase (isomerizing) [Calditrichia bacterium]NUQ41996.1 glutamine--fructose-6-phosphate transaminase (isomerizing) [Calditrichaceae bacterium]